MASESLASFAPPTEHVRPFTHAGQPAAGVGWGRGGHQVDIMSGKERETPSPTSVDTIVQMPLPGPVPIPGSPMYPAEQRLRLAGRALSDVCVCKSKKSKFCPVYVGCPILNLFHIT